MANEVRLYESTDAGYLILLWGEGNDRKVLALFEHRPAGRFVEDAHFLVSGGDPAGWSGERCDSWAAQMDRLQYFHLVAVYDGETLRHPHPPAYGARRYIFGDRVEARVG